MATYFGLRHRANGHLAGWTSESNADGEFCVGTQFTLESCDDSGNTPWLARTRLMAESARTTDTGWYNAGFETPSHPSNWVADEWEVVEITMGMTAI